MSASVIGEFRGSLLVGGSGAFGADRSQRAMLLRSDDGGAVWEPVDDRVFSPDANRVDRMIVTDAAVLVEAVADGDPDGQAQQILAWSDDLDTWHRVELPGRRPDEWPQFVQGGGATVFAVAQRNGGPEGRFSESVIWRSDDGGRRFVAQPALEHLAIGDFLAAGDTLVAVPLVIDSTGEHTEPRGVWVLDGGGEWRELEPDTGTWGDGRVATYATVASESTGRTYALVGRTMRASPHYCFADVETCHHGEMALLATEDGSTWLDVAGFPGLGLTGDPWLLTTGAAGEIVILGAGNHGPPIYVTRSPGGGAPTEAENPDYPAPDIPVELVGAGEPLEVGDERRYLLGLGGCGGVYLDERHWEPETPIPDPPPAEWPHRAVDIADGPSGYVYGRVHRLDADTIEFSIEGIGPVATFHPGQGREYPCG